MIKTLTKHGNILALVIEKPILELLGAGAETPFEITTIRARKPTTKCGGMRARGLADNWHMSSPLL
ncbi:MAG TPA: hypothetical protein PLW97_09565 [Synergistaceae bacterium]|nr:hypothetical protein [Synergistaceae bacterium]